MLLLSEVARACARGILAKASEQISGTVLGSGATLEEVRDLRKEIGRGTKVENRQKAGERFKGWSADKFSPPWT